MDKVEKIKIEIERRRNAIDYIGMPTCAEYNRVWAYNDVLEIIDSLEEEPVSEDLEVAAKSYSAYRRGDDTEISYDINRYEGVIAGAIWQKQQMMKDAIDGWFDEEIGAFNYDWRNYDFKDGDKVKIIIIKKK